MASSQMIAIGIFAGGLSITDNTLMSFLFQGSSLKGVRFSQEHIPKTGIAG